MEGKKGSITSKAAFGENSETHRVKRTKTGDPMMKKGKLGEKSNRGGRDSSGGNAGKGEGKEEGGEGLEKGNFP